MDCSINSIGQRVAIDQKIKVGPHFAPGEIPERAHFKIENGTIHVLEKNVELKKKSYNEDFSKKNRNPRSQKKQSKDLTMQTVFKTCGMANITMGKVKYKLQCENKYLQLI